MRFTTTTQHNTTYSDRLSDLRYPVQCTDERRAPAKFEFVGSGFGCLPGQFIDSQIRSATSRVEDLENRDLQRVLQMLGFVAPGGGKTAPAVGGAT